MSKLIYEVDFTIDFESHDHIEKGTLKIFDYDMAYYEDGSERKVTSKEDAEQCALNYYEDNSEDELVMIPGWILDSEAGIGDTSFDVVEVRTIE